MPVELDRVAFAVPAQRFRISATIARDAPVSLVTEYVLRLISVLGEVTPSGLQAYFGISDFEVTALIKDLIRDSFLDEAQGALVLGPRGKDAFRYGSADDPRISDVVRIDRSIAFDRIAFAPVNDTTPSPRAAIIPVTLDDPTKAESSRQQAEAAFRWHYREIDERYAGDDASAKRPSIQSVDAVRQERHFSFEVVIPINLAVDGKIVAKPDFSAVYESDESRAPLVASLARACSAISVPRDAEDALDFIAHFDRGLMSKVRSSSRGLDVNLWHNNIIGKAAGKLPIVALPFVGAPITRKVKTLLREAFDLAEHEGLAFSGSVLWIRPEVETWGRSYEFTAFLNELTALWGLTEAPTLVSSGTRFLHKPVCQLFEETAAFSHCIVAPDGTLPRALEIILAPGRWIIAIVYQHVEGSDYAVPCGFFIPIASVATEVATQIRQKLLGAQSKLETLWGPLGKERSPGQLIASLTRVPKAE